MVERIDMFGTIFSRKPVEAMQGIPQMLPSKTDEGLVFRVSGISATEWLATPYLFDSHADLGSLLAQLFEEGYGSRDGDQVRLSWAEVYRLLVNDAYTPSLRLLDLPPISKIRPCLSSKGSLLDADFAVVVSGWVGDAGVPLSPAPRIVGAVASVGGAPKLLEEGVWQLLQKVAAFHQRTANERVPDANRRWWGEIRMAAQLAQAPLSDFLQKTIVLTPDKLHLDLRKAGEGEAKTIEVTPTFADAPNRWLEMFDRFSNVQERYDIPNGEELVHVVVTPEVHTVLS